MDDSVMPNPVPRDGALTSEEREFAQILTHNADSLALVRTALDGRPAAVLCAVWEMEDGGVQMLPMAVLVDEGLMARLTDPAVAA